MNYEEADKTLLDQKRQQIQKQAMSMYMPIKALNTFTRDWKIQARVSSKGEKRNTKNGSPILKIEIIDMFGTKIEGAFFGEAAEHFDKKI